MTEYTLKQFQKDLASQAPVPGGGGACAYVAALGMSLGTMVANLTTGKKKYEQYQEEIDKLITQTGKISDELLEGIEKDAKAFGNDPIEIVRDWVSVAEDGYVTLRIRTLWGGITKHVINLVSGVNKDNVYEFDLRHNAQGDTNGRMGDALIAFDLNSLWKKHPKELKIKLNWLSFSGKKSAELSLKMHTVTSVYNAETPSFLHRIE